MYVVYRLHGKTVRKPVKDPKRAVKVANKVHRRYGVQVEVRT